MEEYFATVISNVYLSEKGQTQLRGVYSNVSIREVRRDVKINGQTVIVTDPLPQNWNVMRNPDRFYQNPDNTSVSPRQLMKLFKERRRRFTAPWRSSRTASRRSSIR